MNRLSPTQPVPAALILVSAHAAAADASATVASSHAFDLASGDAPEWVQLLPSGTFRGRDGRGPYLNPDPEEVIRLTREQMSAGSTDALPIDYGHAMEREEASAAPAAGWITDLEARGGEVWGRVSWTPAAAERVRAREFRYLSPVFAHPREGEQRVLYILRAGLTNLPNLIMQSVNSHSSQPENDVKELLKRVAAALGLSEDADEATVLARCSSLQGAQAGLTKVAASVELAASASADEIVTAVQAKAVPDPTKYVPIAQYQTVTLALQAAQQKQGTALVDQLVKEGRLLPAERDWAIAYHAKDPEGFREMASKRPVILEPGAEQGDRGAPPAGDGKKLDGSAKAICSVLDIKQDDFTKNLEVTR